MHPAQVWRETEKVIKEDVERKACRNMGGKSLDFRFFFTDKFVA